MRTHAVLRPVVSFNYEAAARFYIHLHFPTWIIYPSATLKLLAVIAILTKKSRWLKEWAYAGIFFDIVLAYIAHLMADDGWLQMSLFGIAFVLISYYFDRKLFAEKHQTSIE